MGGVLLKKGAELASTAQRWTPKEKRMPIAHREALASVRCTQEMQEKIPQGCKLLIQTDAQATMYLWNKGSKNIIMNSIVHKAQMQLHRKRVYCTAEYIPGLQNKRADHLSRVPDSQDYNLDPQVFKQMTKAFNYNPNLDLFANRTNRKCKQYCSRRLDKMSLGDAFAQNWGKHKNWLNPPWALIPRCLEKIQRDQATALVCLPMWQTAHWWRKLQSMMQVKPIIMRNRSLFQSPEKGDYMPPPRWATLFTIIKG